MASINRNMPNNMYLDIRAESPRDAVSHGYITLNTTQQVLVSKIPEMDFPQSNILLFVRFRADIGAPVSTPDNRTLTLTITD
jgi:hypothetical protein